MQPKDKQTAAMMSETIRELLSDENLMKNVMSQTDKKPIYWNALTKKDGISAIIMAQLIKAMGGDTTAFTALARYGFGEKVQMSVSDFYRDNKIEIEIANPEAIGDLVAEDANKLLNNPQGESLLNDTIEGEIVEDTGEDDGMVAVPSPTDGSQSNSGTA